MKIQRMLVIKIHAVLACFFLPMAALYFISGGLYASGVQGDVDKQVYTLELASPFAPDLAQLSEVARAALQQRGLEPPGGDPAIKEKKGSYEYKWGDLRRQVVMEPTANPLQVELTYRQRSPLAQIMRVHKAEAGLPVKILSISMAIALLAILVSGVFLAYGLPKLRRTALLALGAGLLVLLPIYL